MDVHLHCASYEKITRKTMNFPRLGRRRRCCHGCCCCIVLGGHCKTSKLPTLSTSPFPGLNRPISWPMSWPSFFCFLSTKENHHAVMQSDLLNWVQLHLDSDSILRLLRNIENLSPWDKWLELANGICMMFDMMIYRLTAHRKTQLCCNSQAG